MSFGSVVRFAMFTLALLAVALLASFAASDPGEAQRASKPRVDPALRGQVNNLGGGQAIAIA